MTTGTQNLSTAWQICLMMLLSTIIIMVPDLVYAEDTPMGTVICTVVTWFWGNTGKGLSCIAVVVLGIGALFGKVSWGMAIVVGIGVAIIFGADGIVNRMGAGADGAFCDWE